MYPLEIQKRLNSIGGGITFKSPDGSKEFRIHGPTNNPKTIQQFPNDPGVLGWTARVGEHNPGYLHPSNPNIQYPDKPWGFIYRDNNGNIIPFDATAGHIPIGGNPFLKL